MKSERIAVAPAVLAWARRTAGLDVDRAAHKLTVSAATVEKWESGDLAPTVKQLRKIAKAYKRPLAVLLLPIPPTDFQPVSDFRSAGDGNLAEWSPELHGEVRRALSQREVYLEIADLSPSALAEAAPLPAVSAGGSAEAAAAALRAWLALDDLPATLWGRQRELLNAVIAAVERKGMLVIQTQGVEISEMRGFSLAESPYPVIALNGKDWPRPRLFTLLHELAHVASNLSGLCDLHEKRRHPADADDVEHFCNQVAAAVLIPQSRLLAMDAVRSADAAFRWTLDQLDDLCRPFGSSTEAMLLRLISVQKADWETYRLRKPELDAGYAEARQAAQARQREASGGPNYYVVKARDLGHGYIHSVLDAYQAKAISSLDAADYLEVRFDQISKLEQAATR